MEIARNGKLFELTHLSIIIHSPLRIITSKVLVTTKYLARKPRKHLKIKLNRNLTSPLNNYKILQEFMILLLC